MKIDILITGTGSLAEELLLSLIKITPRNLSIHILGRNLERLQWLKLLVESQSTLLGKQVDIDYSVITLWSQSAIASVLVSIKPELILHTASVQSAWMLNQENKWNKLVKKHGYGLTTILQCHLLLMLCSASASLGRTTPVINASYPDVTNYILHHLGFPVIAGIGNISIMDSLLRSSAMIEDQEKLFFYAHHYHITQLIQGNQNNLPEIYYQGISKHFFDFFNTHFRLPSNDSLNKLTGTISAVQILSYLGILPPYIGHLPGVGGLLGGYPVTISYKKIETRQSKHVSSVSVHERFKYLTAREGIIMNADSICFSKHIVDDFKNLSVTIPTRIKFSDFSQQSHIFLNIKEMLSSED